MASFDDLTEEERQRLLALDRELEEQLLAELAAAEESVLKKKELVKEENKKRRINARNKHGYRRAMEALESAENLVRSLSFELLLCRLKRNDANTVAINTTEFPQGYGEAFGKALGNNTMVTTLKLTASNFLPAGATRPSPRIQPMRDVLSTSSSLVDVHVDWNWNQCDYRFPPRFDLDEEVADLMLESVCSSKSIAKFCTYPSMSPLQFSSLLAQSKSLQEMEVSLPDQRPTNEEREAIVQGLVDNNVLQRLKLWMQYDCLRDGQAYGVDYDVHYVDDDEDAFFEPMITHVLKHLHLVPLRELELTSKEDDTRSGMFGIFTELDQYLQTADVLRRLTIGEILIREALMEKLLSGLGQDRLGVQRVAVEELSFANVAFDDGSSELLLKFMQTPTVDENGATVCKSALRKLCLGIDGWMEVHGPVDLYTDEQIQACWKRLAESLLVPSDASSSAVIQTVGSQIEELYIENVHSSFLRQLSNNACRFRVKRLGLYGTIPANFSELLPKIGTVTDLILKSTGRRRRRRLSSIVAALKYNGSITAVSAGPAAALDPFVADGRDVLDKPAGFNDGQLRLVDAYVERNKFLGSTFGSSSVTNGKQDSDDRGPDDASNTSSAIQVDACHYPSILQCAMDVPVSRLWQALVKFGEQRGSDQPVPSNERAESEQASAPE